MRIPDTVAAPTYGHAHFWDRAEEAGFSRGHFLRRGAAATAGLAGLTLLRGSPAFAAGSDPNPVPGGTQIGPLGTFHFYFPTLANPVGSTNVVANGRGDPSTITDFNGFVGVGEWAGGTGKDQSNTTLYWAADLRFMDGEYVDVNGRHSQGAFAFV